MAIIKGNADNFETEVLKADGPVLVDFWAEWCGPCQMIAKVLEEVSAERPELKICKVNTGEEMALAQQYNVQYIPFLLVFKKGEVVNKITGFQSKEEILQFIDEA
ncbi:MAG: thioredoxin [Eubacteriales bacterium]|nr:thioredoxin [Eubacteriales bacterium]